MRLPYFAIRDHVQTGGLRGSSELTNMLLVGFAWGESASLFASGSYRWQGEQFTYARMIPYSPYSWAIVLLVFSTVMATGLALHDSSDQSALSLRGWLIVIGALGCSVWCAYYAWCFYLSSQDYPAQVSYSGPYQWTFFAVWYMIKVGQHLEFKHVRIHREEFGP